MIQSSSKEVPKDDVLIKVENVGKVFCRDLKKSLWYGIKDSTHDLMSFNQRIPTSSNERFLRPGEFWANKDVSFELRRGECLGLIGRNGAGKTTLLKMLNGLIKPDIGRITMRGRVGALIALGSGFNPILTGKENIYVNGSVLGLTKKEVDKKYDEIVAFSEIDEFIDAPVQSYSSGMKVRLGFAIASSLEPDILLLDEVLAVGDLSFRNKCLIKVGELLENTAVVFVSHQNSQVQRISNKVIWLSEGKIRKEGKPELLLQEYSDQFSNSSSAATFHSTESVEKIVVLSKVDDMNYDETYEITFSVHFKKPTYVGLLVAGIDNYNEKSVAQSMAKIGHTFSDGIYKLRLQIFNLNLNSGNYFVNLNLFSDDMGKSHVARYLKAASFNLVSSRTSYSDYRPRAAAMLIND